MFSSMINVLGIVMKDGLNLEERAEALVLVDSMRNILKITNKLSKALQQNEQDIVNVMTLVKILKQ